MTTREPTWVYLVEGGAGNLSMHVVDEENCPIWGYIAYAHLDLDGDAEYILTKAAMTMPDDWTVEVLGRPALDREIRDGHVVATWGLEGNYTYREDETKIMGAAAREALGIEEED